MQESCMQKDHCIQTYLPVIALTLRDIKLKKKGVGIIFDGFIWNVKAMLFLLSYTFPF